MRFSLALASLLAFVGCEAKPLFDGSGSGGPAVVDTSAHLGSQTPDGRRYASPMSMAKAPQPYEPIACPEDAKGYEAALDAADRLYEAAELPGALACAELAAEYLPQAVEAHHLRGAALATMGYLGEAQTAFAMALALDPDDPETLAAVSDFYINVVQPRSRSHLMLGLEYARRGSERAATRRRADRQLRARLALLVGAGLNDLGSADLALNRVKEALKLSPGWLEADHEKGVSLFNLCRFTEAEAAFARVVEAASSDPYANFYLGLIAERRGDEVGADKHFAIAREVAPTEYFKPVSITAEEFQAELDKAIAELEPGDKELLSAVSLSVDALPALEDLRAVDPPFAPTITGLYRGLPVGVDPADWGAGSATPADTLTHKDGEIPPRAIVLYRKNLIRGAKTRAELDLQIRRTLLHELGHAKGLDEDELRRIGLE